MPQSGSDLLHFMSHSLPNSPLFKVPASGGSHCELVNNTVTSRRQLVECNFTHLVIVPVTAAVWKVLQDAGKVSGWLERGLHGWWVAWLHGFQGAYNAELTLEVDISMFSTE